MPNPFRYVFRRPYRAPPRQPFLPSEPAPAPPTESIRRVEFPVDAWWFEARFEAAFLGWINTPRPADVVSVDASITIHKREVDQLPPVLYIDAQIGFTNSPRPANFVQVDASITIHKREYPDQAWWWEYPRSPESETWTSGVFKGNPRDAIKQGEFPKDAWWWDQPYIEAQITFTGKPFAPSVVAGARQASVEFPVDAWWFAQPDTIPAQLGDTHAPLISHWCEFGAKILFTAANWGAVSFYFEAYIRAFSGTGRARLMNKTDNLVVPGSEVSTVSPTFERLRSGSITLTDGKEYIAQFHGESPTHGTGAKSARVIAI